MKENPFEYTPFVKTQSLGKKTMTQIGKSGALVIFVLDRSGSMQDGQAINHLNAAVNRFASEIVKKDPSLANNVEMMVIAFDNSPEMVLGWTPLGSFKKGCVHLTANGGTRIAPALDQAFKNLEEKERMVNFANFTSFVSYVVLISDGAGGTVDKPACKIKELTKNGRFKFWMLGVKNYDKKTASQLTEAGPQRFYELNDGDKFDFSPFFSELISGITGGGDDGGKPVPPSFINTIFKL